MGDSRRKPWAFGNLRQWRFRPRRFRALHSSGDLLDSSFGKIDSRRSNKLYRADTLFDIQLYVH